MLAVTTGPRSFESRGIHVKPFGAIELAEYGVLQFSWLGLMCICSLGANLLSILALARVPAAYLAPVVYFQILAASTISVVVFDDALDNLALVGLMVIVAAGLSRIPVAMRLHAAQQSAGAN